MDSNVNLNADSETILSELQRIGFDRFEIDRALHWLTGMQEFQQTVTSQVMGPHSIRYYGPEEVERLGVEGQGLLTRLEQLNILDPATREMVIDRIMALDPREVDLRRIRWVVLMALFNQPEKKSALILLQDMILADALDVLH